MGIQQPHGGLVGNAGKKLVGQSTLDRGSVLSKSIFATSKAGHSLTYSDIISIEQLQLGPVEEGEWLANKRVLIRVDFNVPIDKKTGKVRDDTRILAALPTIEFAVACGAKVILASHMGRPKGQRDDRLSLEIAGARLAELTGYEVHLPDDCIGDSPKKVINDLRVASATGQVRGAPQICLLENLRFYPEEKANDALFARKLADLCDVYINDAFGAMHRAHASVDALPRMMKDRGAGMLVWRELKALGRLAQGPASPYVAILGGAKVSDKIDVIEALLSRCDSICIGGAMANTFLAALGHNMQASLVEEDKLALARTLLEKANAAGVELLLPSDLKVGQSLADTTAIQRPVNGLSQGELALDIGDATAERFSKVIATAKTIFWNGPMGLFESEAFASGTMAVAKAMSQAEGYTVVGGGDSAAAVRQAGESVAKAFNHISTGGGASLALIEGKRLPGILALRRNSG